MSGDELKTISNMQYYFLVTLMEVERAVHPKSYKDVLRVGERIKENIEHMGQLENLKPLPPLDDKCDE